MAFRTIAIVLIWLNLIPHTDAVGQENLSICNWAHHRAAQVGNSIYLNGGNMWKKRATGDLVNDGGSGSELMVLSLSQVWDNRTINLSGLLDNVSDHSYSVANLEGGAMFGNSDRLILYGGLPTTTSNRPLPDSKSVLGFEPHRENANSIYESGSFFNQSLPGNITQHISNGASVSAPSENMGFYFSGQRGKDWGPIASDDASANTSASSLIGVNMTAPEVFGWRNASLPSAVLSRANAEVVWVPRSHNGILVVIGGTKHPESIYAGGLSSEQKKQDAEMNPVLMKTIPIYDIGSQTWYLQNTTGDIPLTGRTMFCSVLASAADHSSHNIYIYGGYDGEDAEHSPFDDVYILSLPSFIWTKAYAGRASHGRSGHKCFRVFPDQMLVVGGLYKDPSLCLEDGAIQNFNLNDLRFQGSYSPAKWEAYSVPNIITSQIGGDGNGGANRTSPKAWADDGLRKVFGEPYTKSIPVWYPYTTAGRHDAPTGNNSGDTSSHKRPRKVAVAVGVSVPAALLLGCLVWFCWRCPRRHKRATMQFWHHHIGRLFKRMPFAKGGRHVQEADGKAIAGPSLPSPPRVRDKTEEGPVELATPCRSSSEDTTTCMSFMSNLSITRTPSEIYEPKART